MADSLVGPGFDLVGYRQVPGQTQTEFFNKESGLTFEKPEFLSNFINSQYGLNTTKDDVFSVLAAGYRSQALSGIKDQLNSYQNTLYNQENQPAVRASSSLNDAIASENNNYNSYLKEYNDLRTKLDALQTPNYLDTYNQLRTSSGMAGIEDELAANEKATRELPYVNRMNFGNAGVATEGQLNADTEQKGIPLEIQQANILDRLKLAQDFVNNSLKFKEMDANQARQAVSDAINAVSQALNLSGNHINQLFAQNQQLVENALNRGITARFYVYPGSAQVFDSLTNEPLSFEQYKARGGVGEVGGGAFADVQTITNAAKPIELSPGNTLVDPTTGKVIYKADYTPSKYTTGSGGGGGSGGGSSPGSTSSSLTSAQVTRVKQIIAANPGEYGHAADQIDKEFGAGTATKADTLLKTAYLIPSDAAEVGIHAPANMTVEQWQAGLERFVADHSYNTTAAVAAYKKYVKYPSKTTSNVPIQ